MKIKSGFTLVELSIVLVIIGLLIGGILIGQSLIQSAQINGVIKQLTQYDILFANFKQKFKQLPGDATLWHCQGAPNNNGTMDNLYEGMCYWANLSTAFGLKNSKGASYVYTDPFAATIDHLPALKMDQISTVQGLLSARPGGVLRYQTRVMALDPQSDAPIKPSDLLSIDNKIDDGIANSGSVYNYRMTCCGGDSSPICEVSGVYQTANSYACTPVFRIGGTNGNSYTK